MSYFEANKCFQENLKKIGDPENDPKMWNISNGLMILSDAIQHDLSLIRRDLQNISNDLKRR